MDPRGLVDTELAAISPEALKDPAQAQAFVDNLFAQVDAFERYNLFKHLLALEQDLGVALPLPQISPPRRRPEPMRRAYWAAKANAVFRLAEHLGESLLDRHGGPDRFAALALLSAIVKGGLLRPETWPVFHNHIASGAKLTSSPVLGDLVWLDLEFRRQKGRAAQGADFETLRFFPDVTTLALIAKAKGADLTHDPRPDKLLARSLRAADADHLGITTDILRTAGFAALEDASPSAIPGILLEVAGGSIPSYSTSAETWAGMLTGQISRTRLKAFDKAQKKPSRQVNDAGHHRDVDLSIKGLNDAVTAKRPGAAKQTRAPIIAALRDLLRTDLVPMVRAIALWTLDLLERRRSPSTIQRYTPAMLRDLAGRFGADDPADMPQAQIEVLTQDALALLTRDERLYRASRMAQFFKFAAAHPQLGWPMIELEVEGEASPRIRTALCSSARLKAALQGFERDTLAQVAVLLAGRGGLRLSDMEALRLGDVESGPNGMLRIHETQWGSLKTSASRRMIPFAALLTADEGRIWNGFLNKRLSETTDKDTRLLATGGGLLPFVPFNRHDFARELARSVGLRPHDLRHGALSHLGLLLLAPEKALPTVHRLTGWSVKRCKDLRARMTAKDPWRGMSELARFAGHRDPATTFESYIHICDLALGMHVQAAAPPTPRQTIRRELGLNTRSLPDGTKPICAEDLRGKILKRLDIVALSSAPMGTAPVLKPDAQDTAFWARVEAAIREGLTAFALCERFNLSMPVANTLLKAQRLRPLPREKDRAHLTVLAEHILSQEGAKAWALQTLRAPATGISFYAPFAAEAWIAAVKSKMRLILILKTNDPRRWGQIARRATVQPTGVKGLETVRIRPVLPDGRSGMPLLQVVAQLVLNVLQAREVQAAQKA